MHIDIKLLTTKARRTWLVSEPNPHTKTFYSEKLLAMEIKIKKYSWINQSI